MDASVKPEEESSDNELCPPTMAEVLAENARLREENENLKAEMTMKDQRSDKVEDELRETIVTLDRITRKHGIFHRFPKFPPEIRQMIYSNLPLSDRVSAAMALPDTVDYFRKFPVKNVSVSISLVKEEGDVYIRLNFFSHLHIEMHRIPEADLERVRLDLESSKDCPCEFCAETFLDDFGRQIAPDGAPRVLYRDYDPGNSAKVFGIFRLVEICCVHFKSCPSGGLVDFVQPEGQLPTSTDLLVNFHLPENERYLRYDTRIDVVKWGKWFEFFRPSSIKMHVEYGKDEEVDFFSEYCGPLMHLPRKFYDLKAFHNAETIVQRNCLVDINYRQLALMKANWLVLGGAGSILLTDDDIREYYKKKMQEWMSAPATDMWISVQSAEPGSANAPDRCQMLLQEMREELFCPDNFRVYRSIGDGFVIRCMKTDNSLWVFHRTLRCRPAHYRVIQWPTKVMTF